MHPLALPFAALTLAALPGAPAGSPVDSVLLALRGQAELLAPLMRTPLARRFLAATAALPKPPVRTLYRDSLSDAYYSEAEARSLPTIASSFTPYDDAPESPQFNRSPYRAVNPEGSHCAVE